MKEQTIEIKSAFRGLNVIVNLHPGIKYILNCIIRAAKFRSH
jgi:hypothetical protein